MCIHLKKQSSEVKYIKSVVEHRQFINRNKDVIAAVPEFDLEEQAI